MKSTDLLVLARRLMKVAEEGLPGKGVNNSVRFVLLDIASNPGSSISEITARTGYPQSHVSTSVIKLRESGFVRTEIDPVDRPGEVDVDEREARPALLGKRQGLDALVWIVPKAVDRAHNRIIATADAAIRRALGNPPAAEVAEVVGALEMVAERLGPLAGPQNAKEAS